MYMDRIVHALYQLNDVQFDLLSTSPYQLDVCWPTTEYRLIFLFETFYETFDLDQSTCVQNCLQMP